MRRASILFLTGLLINTVILVRLVQQYSISARQHKRATGLRFRNAIYDRNGLPLAFTALSYSAYINPATIDEEVLSKLQEQIDPDKLSKILNTTSKFAWLDRHSSNPSAFEEIANIMPDSTRSYPMSSMAHIIGRSDPDQNGVSGLEYYLDLDRYSYTLTIDSRVQAAVHQTLKEGMEEFSATAANAVVIEVHTGEIIAIVSLPDLNTKDPATLFERNLQGVYEFGSVMKVGTLAMALESEKYTLDTIINIPAYIQYGKFQIKDFGENIPGPISLLRSFTHSSNKANVLVALDLGSDHQRAFCERLGYFDRLPLHLPVAKPISPKKWSKGTLITSSFGYGIAVTPLHLIRGFARLLTGKRVDLSLVMSSSAPLGIDQSNKKDRLSGNSAKDLKEADVERWIAEIARDDSPIDNRFCQQIQEALEACVLQGYASKVRVPGIRVGAKTGTANIGVKGKYIENNNRVTALAAFPLYSKPMYALLVTLEQPKVAGPHVTAGLTAAPIAGKIIQKIAPLLSVFAQK